MQLYIIRHCQSENNAKWAQLGNSTGRVEDPLLTEIGRKQAEQLAQHIAFSDPYVDLNGSDHHNRMGYQITHLYCSLMERAIQTGSAIAEATELPLVAWEEIHETGGIFLKNPETGQREGQPGKNRAFFEAHYPYLILPDDLNVEGWWNRPFEEKPQIMLRAQGFIQELLERHGDSEDRVAIVTHGGFSQAIITQLLELHYPLHETEMARPVWFRFNNGSITRIDMHADYVMVAYLNSIGYMPSSLVT
jgi:2,3-bisphosphoglycerate-dependent phosphoglycerate mutase